MRRLVDYTKASLARRHGFLTGAKAEIQRENLNMACFASCITTTLLAVFLLVTPAIIPGWEPSVYHFAFLPVSVVFTVLTLTYRHFIPTPRYGTVIGIAFACALCTCTILIDALSEPIAPGSFIPLVFVTLPSLLVVRFAFSYGIIIFFDVLYWVLCVTFKNPYIAQYDVFQSLVSLAFSLCLAHLVMRYRINAWETRRRFEELSKRDTLSDIYNKRTLIEMAQAVIRAAGPVVSCALVVIDLDDFKGVNDQRGHYSGDTVLRDMARLLKEHFRSSDVLGRFGGDEFIVLMRGSLATHVVAAKLASLQQAFSDATEASVGARMTCSVGAIIAREQPVDFDSLFVQADDALYEAKRGQKGGVVIRDFRTLDASARGESAAAFGAVRNLP